MTESTPELTPEQIAAEALVPDDPSTVPAIDDTASADAQDVAESDPTVDAPADDSATSPESVSPSEAVSTPDIQAPTVPSAPEETPAEPVRDTSGEAVFAATAIPVDVPDVPDNDPIAPAEAAPEDSAQFAAHTVTDPAGPVTVQGLPTGTDDTAEVDTAPVVEAAETVATAAAEIVATPADIKGDADEVVRDIHKMVTDIHGALFNAVEKFPEIVKQIESSPLLKIVSKFIKTD